MTSLPEHLAFQRHNAQHPEPALSNLESHDSGINKYEPSRLGGKTLLSSECQDSLTFSIIHSSSLILSSPSTSCLPYLHYSPPSASPSASFPAHSPRQRQVATSPHRLAACRVPRRQARQVVYSFRMHASIVIVLDDSQLFEASPSSSYAGPAVLSAA